MALKETHYSRPSLGSCFGVDLASAAFASTLVSPLVAVIDGTIVTKAATGESLKTCFQSWLQKSGGTFSRFLRSKPFFLIFSLYFGTYTTANSIDTIHSNRNNLPPSAVSATTAKFLGTTAASTGLCVYKDGRFARIYGSSLSKAPVPTISYALFTARDGITVFASFILPSLLAPSLSESAMAKVRPFSYLIGSESSGLKTAQILSPAFCQFVTTPIHLLGLDLHNRQHKLGVLERVQIIRRDVFVAIPLRMLRIVPAFGIGNVVNISVRRSLMEKVVEQR